MGYIVDDISCSYVCDGEPGLEALLVRITKVIIMKKEPFTIIAHTFGTCYYPRFRYAGWCFTYIQLCSRKGSAVPSSQILLDDLLLVLGLLLYYLTPSFILPLPTSLPLLISLPHTKLPLTNLKQERALERKPAFRCLLPFPPFTTGPQRP